MLRIISAFLGIVCLIGCTSAPVQEMSDARQAIVAARQAGATETTSPDLYAAQAAITRAEKHIQAQEYTRARLAAMQAKRHAGAALAGAQTQTAAAPPPTTNTSSTPTPATPATQTQPVSH